MKIAFAPSRPADAAVLALPVRKGDALTGLVAGADALIEAAARGARFEGEAGSSAELFVAADGIAQRIVLLGVGTGDDAAYERAGGALTARLLTSGATSAVADLSGVDAAATARFAAGAAQLGVQVHAAGQPPRRLERRERGGEVEAGCLGQDPEAGRVRGRVGRAAHQEPAAGQGGGEGV